MTRDVARPTSTLTMLVGLVLISMIYGGCDARRMYINQRHDSLKEVTPSEPIDVGGWRPVIDSRYDATRPQLPDGYDPMSPLTSGPSGPGDQTADLIPPPRGSNKPIKKIKPTRKTTIKTPELSESRATPPTYALSETRPTMRFPDEKRRNPIRRQRPNHPHHVHYHVRQPPAFSVAESNQQLRFRPSPQAPAAYENPFPGWLLQPQQQEEQQQVYYNSDNSGLLQLQQQFNSDSQIQLALQQQQPDLAQQQFSHQHQQQEIAPQSSYQHSQGNHGAFLPGSTQVFGNANLFSIQNEKGHRPHDNLFLIPSPTEPSVHENEVPQGPSIFQGHTTRGRPVRPTFDIPTDIPKYQIPDITYQQQENSDHRPRRPRPPTGIQAQLELSNNRRPIVNENEGTLRITEVRPSQQTPRHPRPPSTEPPSWSHPVQDVESTVRPRRPRPTQQTQFASEDTTSNDTPILRRPRPPVQEQMTENDNQEKQRVRRPRPPVQEQSWRPSNDEPEEVAPTQTTQFETQVKPQRTRQPPPVLEEIEDDIDRPVFTLRPRRPQPVTEEPKTEEGEVQRVRRPRPPVVEEETVSSDVKKTEEQNTQEDVDEPVNVRPRRPRPPPESEDRPVRTRRPRPPQEGLRRRRPTTARPEIEEEAPAEHQPVRRRRPQRPAVAEESEEPERKPHRRPARPWNQRVQHQQQQTPEETTEAAVAVEPETKYAESIPEESAPQDVMMPEESNPEESSPDDSYPAFLPVSYDNFPEYPSLEVQPETTQEPPTTSQAPSLPTFPPKRRRPAYKFEESEPTDNVNSAENYPTQFKATTEAATTPAPITTTLPPTTTFSVINSRLRARLNATRQRYGGATRLSALTSKRNKNEETTTEASTSAPEEINSSRIRQKSRDSSRFKLGSTTTTEEPSVERTTFKPSVSRFPRPGNRYYSRYRAGNEETETTTPQQDATRRTNVNIYSAGKERRKYPLKTSEESVTEIMSKEPTTASYLIADFTTNMPEITTIPPTENEINVKSEEIIDEKTEIPTTYEPDLEPESTTVPADFSPAKRVTDLTSSATAFKPLSFFSAVPADGKHASQLSSRFTMATEDPILPLEAFFPTFTSKPRQQEDDK